MKADDPRLQPGVYRNHKGRVRRVTYFHKRSALGGGHIAGDVYYTVNGATGEARTRINGVIVPYNGVCWSTSWVSWLGPAGKWHRLPDDWTPDAPPPPAIEIVFDDGPGPEGGRFVEVEQGGKGISFGEWQHRPDGLWALVLPAWVAEEYERRKDR